MNGHGHAASAENPFAACRLRPGGLPYFFHEPPPADGDPLAALVERLQKNGYWGQIVGPHGTGKSTLLAALRGALEEADCELLLIELHDGQRRLPIDLRRAWEADRRGAGRRGVILIDGYEQLGRLVRWRVRRQCRRLGLGLLATAHASVGLPELARTKTSLAMSQRIAAELQQGYPRLVGEDDVRQRYPQFADDPREMLFALYDVYEARRR